MTNRSSFATALRNFLRHDSASGVLLLGFALAAMAIVNSPWAGYYATLLHTPPNLQLGGFTLNQPLLLWINDGLMPLFFLIVGLELKREFLEGDLSRPAQAILPAAAAAGGMLVPALIYAAINWGDPLALRGWAIPSATDIAFAVGVLSLLGKRIPASLKLFLLTLAILDDLGAILIIAVYYSGEIAPGPLAFAALALALLFLMNRRNVAAPAAFALVGLALWLAILKSGIHPTVAGVLLAVFIPLRTGSGAGRSLLPRFEAALYPWVAYVILPIFAFANAGMSLEGISFATLLEPVPMGIAAGLFVGKQVGVLAVVALAVWSGLATLPEGTSWRQMYGAAILCGIGFTMSVFIGSLAFEGAPQFGTGVQLGVIAGSLLSALAGFLLLRVGAAPPPERSL
jgi:NhaA family Na+:H+ antiporter